MVFGLDDGERVLKKQHDEVNTGKEDVEGKHLRGVALIRGRVGVNVYSQTGKEDKSLNDEDATELLLAGVEERNLLRLAFNHQARDRDKDGEAEAKNKVLPELFRFVVVQEHVRI
jgi:hypothetical protein